MDVELTTSPLLTGLADAFVLESNNSSNAWGLGPRAGLEASCLLGKGFRFLGDAAVSVLYTQYTHITHQEAPLTAALPNPIGITQTNMQTVRPELDLGLGIGYGTYISKQRFHFDLSANYDFIVFWEQNMIRKLLDEAITGVGSAANNIYMQGLNVTARFDF